MASGRKNYFRHSFSAGKDDKIVNLIANHGKQAYFHFFRLIELCCEQIDSEVPEKFVFHRRTLCAELMVTNSRLGHHLLAIQSSLLGEYVMTPTKAEILIYKLPKYLGRYSKQITPNSPNKKKRKENKRKESKVKETTRAAKPLLSFLDDEISDLLKIISESNFEKWHGRYGDKDWINEGIVKALRYHNDNHVKGRTVEGWNRFLSNNLANQFEWHPPKKKAQDDYKAMILEAVREADNVQ